MTMPDPRHRVAPKLRPRRAFAVDVRRRTAGLLTLRLVGNLDSLATEQVWAAIDGDLAEHPSDVIIDFSQVSMCNGTGLALLARLDRRVRSTGQRVTVIGAGPIVVRLLEVGRLDHLIEGRGATTRRA